MLSAADEGRLDFRSIELVVERATNRLELAVDRAADLAAASGVSLAISIASDDRLAAAAVVAESLRRPHH